jgi:hypothetical protein
MIGTAGSMHHTGLLLQLGIDYVSVAPGMSVLLLREGVG